MADVYTKHDLAEKTHRTSRIIQRWTDKGLIFPDVRGSKGKGIERLYSERNLVEALMVDNLSREMGVCIALIRSIMKTLRNKQFGRIDFHDFWTSPTWGIEKDLLLFTDSISSPPPDSSRANPTSPSEDDPPSAVYATIDYSGYMHYDIVPINMETGRLESTWDALGRSGWAEESIVIILRLGKIKTIAEQRL